MCIEFRKMVLKNLFAGMEVRNRFKGLDLIDRVPDELWTEVCDIVWEAGSKTIPKKKICKRARHPGV